MHVFKLKTFTMNSIIHYTITSQVVTPIFIFHVTEQIYCKDALKIDESRSGIPFLTKLGCYLMKDLRINNRFSDSLEGLNGLADEILVSNKYQ